MDSLYFLSESGSNLGSYLMPLSSTESKDPHDHKQKNHQHKTQQGYANPRHPQESFSSEDEFKTTNTITFCFHATPVATVQNVHPAIIAHASTALKCLVQSPHSVVTLPFDCTPAVLHSFVAALQFELDFTTVERDGMLLPILVLARVFDCPAVETMFSRLLEIHLSSVYDEHVLEEASVVHNSTSSASSNMNNTWTDTLGLTRSDILVSSLLTNWVNRPCEIGLHYQAALGRMEDDIRDAVRFKHARV